MTYDKDMMYKRVVGKMGSKMLPKTASKTDVPFASYAVWCTASVIVGE